MPYTQLESTTAQIVYASSICEYSWLEVVDVLSELPYHISSTTNIESYWMFCYALLDGYVRIDAASTQ